MKTGMRFFVTTVFVICVMAFGLRAQSILFDFNNAPLLSPLPVDQTVSGVTAHFSATGQGYSIQEANTMGFAPWGMDGRCIYPSSVYLSDLLIRFDQPISDFSILYSCQELGCDDAATMRVTAFMNGISVGTNTKTAGNPGTWPTDSLQFNFSTGFDSVVIHYDSHPPTCQDYGVIYLADNLRVTAFVNTGLFNSEKWNQAIIFPNRATEKLTIEIPSAISPYQIEITDALGSKIYSEKTNLKSEIINLKSFPSGIYFIKVQMEDGTVTVRKFVKL